MSKNVEWEQHLLQVTAYIYSNAATQNQGHKADYDAHHPSATEAQSGETFWKQVTIIAPTMTLQLPMLLTTLLTMSAAAGTAA